MREVDSLRALRATDAARLVQAAQALAAGPAEPGLPVDSGRADPPAAFAADPLAGLPDSLKAAVVQRAVGDAAGRRAEAEAIVRGLEWNVREANAARVEIHKKQSIALACFVFALAGAYLGLGVQARRGGLARAGITALFLFLFYWVTLVIGEKLSDRYLWMPPWLGMWLANALIGVSFAALFARKMARHPSPTKG